MSDDSTTRIEKASPEAQRQAEKVLARPVRVLSPAWFEPGIDAAMAVWLRRSAT